MAVGWQPVGVEELRRGDEPPRRCLRRANHERALAGVRTVSARSPFRWLPANHEQPLSGVSAGRDDRKTSGARFLGADWPGAEGGCSTDPPARPGYASQHRAHNVKKRSSSPLSPRAQSRLQPSQASKAAALRVGTAALLAPGVRCPPAAAAMAPKAEKKPAKKVVKASGGKGKKGKKSVETYKIYIYKVLKQVRFCPAAALSAACCLSNPP